MSSSSLLADFHTLHACTEHCTNHDHDHLDPIHHLCWLAPLPKRLIPVYSPVFIITIRSSQVSLFRHG